MGDKVDHLSKRLCGSRNFYTNIEAQLDLRWMSMIENKMNSLKRKKINDYLSAPWDCHIIIQHAHQAY